MLSGVRGGREERETKWLALSWRWESSMARTLEAPVVMVDSEWGREPWTEPPTSPPTPFADPPGVEAALTVGGELVSS